MNDKSQMELPAALAHKHMRPFFSTGESRPGVMATFNANPRLPLVYDSPHSGDIYPDDFDAACPHDLLIQAEDKHIERLFHHVCQDGAGYLCALFPRTYIDVNRRDDDIDNEILDQPWPKAPGRPGRSHAGIGLIRRLLRPGMPLYDRPLTHGEVNQRLTHYYIPYHQQLQKMLDRAHYHFGACWYISCHSMPRHTAYPQALSPQRRKQARSLDFCLGDIDGQSCRPDFTHFVKDRLENHGFQVGLNDPYRGVELLERHGRPAQGRNALQIEINKSLYMDEKSGAMKPDTSKLQDALQSLTNEICDYVNAQMIDRAAD